MTKLTTNRNYKAVAGVVFAFLVCVGSFVPTPVYADFGTAELWSLVNAGLVSSPAVTSLKNSVVEQYTSLSPGELTMLEYELAAVYTVGSVVLSQDWFTEHGLTFDSLNGSYTLTGLTGYNNSNNLYTLVPCSVLVSPSGLILNSDVGGFSILPAVLNGNTLRPSFSDGGSYGIVRFDVSGGNDCTLGVNGYGVVDGYNGVGQPRSAFAVAGYYRERNYSVYLTYPPLFWNNDFSEFQQTSIPFYCLNYCSMLPLDNIETPLELYNYAYNKALEDYPEYIENWVDLEDDFNAVEPDVFDSLEFPPYIPNVDFHDVEVPTETLPTGLTEGAGFWFSAFSNLVDAFNLKPYVILFLCIMLVMVILKI